jgi:glutathione synthase/RimK-type ligase-like ATP-grasp enzyme
MILEKKSKYSKYSKYNQLLHDDELADAMPETKRFTKITFMEMLSNYKTIIVKPRVGSNGYKVLKITENKAQYVLHNSKKEEIFKDVSMLYGRVKKITKSRKFLVQQYIPLAKINDRPFDIRAIVQRKIGFDWAVTGMYAKVANDGFFITNLRTKSKVIEVNKAILDSNIDSEDEISVEEIHTKLNSIVLKTAAIFGEAFNNHNIWGLDLGIDQTGKVWIIEANSTPGYKGFRMLKNKANYRMIKSIKKHNKMLRENFSQEEIESKSIKNET